MSSSSSVAAASASASGKVARGTISSRQHYQNHNHQATTSTTTTSVGAAQCNTCYQQFDDKGSLHKHWKSHAHAFLPTTSASTSTSTREEFLEFTNGSGDSRKEDDGDESRLIIDLDTTAQQTTTGSESTQRGPLTSATTTTPSNSLLLQSTQHQQAASNFQLRTMTTTNTNSNHPQQQQQQQQQHGDFFQIGGVGVSTAAAAAVGLAHQMQLHQQQNNVNNRTASTTTPRLQQQAQQTNPYLLSAAALSPYAAAAAQQLLARAAASASNNVVGGGATSNQQAQQVFLPNVAQQAALPYQYLMNGFSPFFNVNEAAVAAAIANAGLLVPQQALASAAAAAQLLCQQGGGGAGTRIQGQNPTSASASTGVINEHMGIQLQKANLVNNYEAQRRVSAPDLKNVVQQRHQHNQIILEQDLILNQHHHQQQQIQQMHQGNNQCGPSTTGNSNSNLAPPPQPPAQSSNNNNNAAVTAALSREAVSEHIKRLISENEAIVEPPPALLKRRSYTKCHQGSASLDFGSSSIQNQNLINGQNNSNLIRPPFGRSNRSQSLIDPPAVAAAAQHHLARQQLLQQQQSSSMKNEDASPSPTNINLESGQLLLFKPACQFCNIPFRNAASLRAHEFRCAQNSSNGSVDTIPEMVSPKIEPPSPGSATTTTTLVSGNGTPPARQATSANTGNSVTMTNGGAKEGGENKHPLKKRILAAAELDALKFGANNNSTATSSATPVRSPESDKSIAAIGSGSINQQQSNADELSKSVSTSPSVIANRKAIDFSASASSSDSLISPNQSQQFPNQKRRQSIAANQSIIQHQSPSTSSFVGQSISILPKSSLLASSSDRSHRFYPYRLTFKVQDESSISGSKIVEPRTKSQQVTQPTYCCHRKSPIAFSSEGSESMYSIWPQVSVSPSEAKLNIMMMGGCNVRARWTGVKYSTASTDLGSMITTGSIYWEQSKRLQRLAAAAVMASSTSTSTTNSEETIDEEEPIEEDDEEEEEEEEKISKDEQEVIEEENGPKDKSESKTEIDSKIVDSEKEKSIKSSRQRLKDILTSGGSSGLLGGRARKVIVCNGGYKTNEAYTYVRGRGRGRYVCERCGIRCKKPSMLKKHIRTHLNVRPYTCPQCMFSFKTKGNLTKHMKSQAHSKKLASLTTKGGNGFGRRENGDLSRDEASRFDNDSEDDTEEHEDVDGYSTEDDVDENDRCVLRDGEFCTAELRRRRYSYKNIWTNVKDGCYPQRSIRTPPPPPMSTSQPCVNYSELFDRCDTAPPALNSEHSNSNSRSFDGHEINKDKDDSSIDQCSISRTNFETEKSIIENSSSEPISKSISTSIDRENRPETELELATTSTSSSSATLEPYFLHEGKSQCEICGASFPKIGSLRLHMNVHYFEKTGRRYEYKCSYCNSSFRSRSLLQKHTSTAHQKQIQQSAEKNIDDDHAEAIGHRKSATCNEDQTENSMSTTTTTSISTAAASEKSQSNSSNNNPRPFECSDCNIAFRIHGHLSKHLRSKLHITKLECTGKLPIGLFAKLEDAGAQHIAEIDTSDCANSFRSLVKLADQFHMATSDDEIQGSKTKSISATITTTASVSLACTEEMLPTSPPPPPSTQASMISTSKFQEQSTEKSITESKSANGLISKSVVTATDVWIPPTMEKLERESEKSAATTSTTGNCNNNNGGDCNQRCCVAIENSKIDKSIKSPSTSISTTTTSTSLCRFCNSNFPSPLELEIHFHVDHVVMRDGNDFRCPRANCDSVYPNKDSLRQHLTLHFYGKLDDNHSSPANGGGGGGANLQETNNNGGGDVSKSTVAALSRKLGGHATTVNGGETTMVEAANQQSSKNKKTMKTHLVKLSSIPESAINSQIGNDNVASSTFCNSNSNSSSSRGGVVGCCASTDNSPISGNGLDSDASRASINSSHSGSPVLTAAESPANLDQTSGRSSTGRQSAKRKSLDDHSGAAATSASKRTAAAATMMTGLFDHQQFLQLQSLQQQQQLQQQQHFSSTPPSLNGLYQRMPTPSSMQSSQSPVIFHQTNQNGQGNLTPNSLQGWSPSPLMQQFPTAAAVARQQLSPPQAYYFGPNGASSFFGLQNQLASAAMAQHNAAKLLAVGGGGMNSFWNSQTAALAAHQFFNSATTTNQEAAALSGLTGFNEAATAAAIGFLLPQPCILCGKQCANSAMLQEHLLTHSQARPYVCEHCDAGFTTEHALQSHRPCRQQRIDV